MDRDAPRMDRGIRSDRHLAAAAERGEHSALRVRGRVRGRMIEGLYRVEPRTRGKRLDGQSALTDRGTHTAGVEDFCDAIRPAETFETGGGQDNGVELALIELPNPRIHIAADGLNDQI